MNRVEAHIRERCNADPDDGPMAYRVTYLRDLYEHQRGRILFGAGFIATVPFIGAALAASSRDDDAD